MNRSFFTDVASASPPTVPADTIRLARAADAPAVAELIERSCLAAAIGSTGRRHARALLEAGLANQEQPIRDGTCYVAESGDRVIGVCAWGRWPDAAEVGADRARGALAPRYHPTRSAGRVRALAVDPGHPPVALSRLLLMLCESAAGRQGFDALDATPSPPQAWLYLACGFHSVGPLEVRCPRCVRLPCLLVRKPLRAVRPFLAGRTRPASRHSYRSFTASL